MWKNPQNAPTQVWLICDLVEDYPTVAVKDDDGYWRTLEGRYVMVQGWEYLPSQYEKG